MKIRLSLTISLTRDPDVSNSPEPPAVDDKGAAQVERAERQAVGFAIDPYRSDPFEDER